MKKILGILVLSFFWSNYSLADFPSSNIQNQWINSGKIFTGMNWKQFNKLGGLGGADYGPIMSSSKGNYILTIQQENIYIFKKKPNEKAYSKGFTSKKPILIKIYNNADVFQNWENAKAFIINKEGSATFYKAGGMDIESTLAKLNSGPLNKTKKVASNTPIEFNIAKKKEQCEAIGFKPETEKFADCVLRLVELDVKTQQNNQIIAAENAGNQELVNQLERQRNLQASQALIDLGRQLSQPRKYNSKIYHPKTQNCILQGFGTFSKMTCN